MVWPESRPSRPLRLWRVDAGSQARPRTFRSMLAPPRRQGQTSSDGAATTHRLGMPMTTDVLKWQPVARDGYIDSAAHASRRISRATQGTLL